jgi:hypothetical protein
MSDETNVIRYSRKIEEALTTALLYSIGEEIRNPHISPKMKGILSLLLEEISYGFFLHDCDCNSYAELSFKNENISLTELDVKIREELCSLSQRILRSLSRDALRKIEFPEEDVLDQLKEKLPVLFAD